MDGLLLLLILLAAYFLPGLLALARAKRNWFAIGLTNLLFGWTVLGWLLCLIWACTVDPKA